ncbi:MAG: ABC transporter ATP-binding protein [Propionibacteriaceae bacterium]|nr:ABC transporter ATP-binding protein [Propionibacteriaceae bacterium]
MIRQFRTYLDRPSSLGWLLAGFVLAAILQGVAFGLLVGFLRDFLGPDPSSAWSSLWVMLICGGAAFVVSSATTVHANKVSSHDVVGNVISRIGRRVTQLPLGWFDSNSVGRVSAAVTVQADALTHLASMVLPQIIQAVVTPLTVIVIVWFYDWHLGLVMTLVIPFVALLWRWVMRVLDREQREEPEISARTANRLLEQAQLQPVLRAHELSGIGWQPVAKALDEEDAAVRSLMAAQARPMNGFILVAQAFLAVVWSFGLSMVLGGQLDLPAYIAIAVMATRFTGPIAQSALYGAEVQRSAIALTAIGEVLDAPLMPPPTDPRRPADTSIALDGVGFSYADDARVFDDLSLNAHAGSMTALVGPSGCGKSTITRLMARFWDVDTGSVSIGGADVRQIDPAELMSMISMVFQDVYLFDTTIIENVRISRPDATDEEVAEAIRRAGLGPVLASLPQGGDTRVGEGGDRLSGGERQRVSIARAFLKDSPILLLDEITSALDAENEAAITSTLLELARGRTVIVIAHRLSTVMAADQVYVLAGRESGVPTRVIEQGSPQELAASGGVFASMVADFEETARWQVR